MDKTAEAAKIDWIQLIGGGFGHTTAHFAMHATDKALAKEYLILAKKHGVTVEEAISHAEAYLPNANGPPTDVQLQLRLVRKYFKGKLPE